MGSPLSLFACIGTMNRPLTRPSTFVKPTADKSGTLSPIGGEGWGEGARFMGRENLSSAPENAHHFSQPGFLAKPYFSANNSLIFAFISA